MVEVTENGCWCELMPDETWARARRSGRRWLCSTLSNTRVVAEFDSSGLVELIVEPIELDWWIDASEFNALMADTFRPVLPKDHPCWFVVVGQFE